MAYHRSFCPGRMRVNGSDLPPGPCQTTLHPSASCPSRYAVTDTGRCSPTTAFAGYRPHSTEGFKSSIANRPTTVSP
jgi:hypothetical protein